MTTINPLEIVSIQNITPRIVRLATAIAFTTGLLISFGSMSRPAVAGQTCTPDVSVTNRRTDISSIKVLNFKYRIGSDPKVYTEGLLNNVLTRNETERWNNQRLGSAVNGVVITSTAIEYREDTGTGFGSPKLSVWVPHSFTCGTSRTYTHTIQ
jgi:hypothetical protein